MVWSASEKNPWKIILEKHQNKNSGGIKEHIQRTQAVEVWLGAVDWGGTGQFDKTGDSFTG